MKRRTLVQSDYFDDNDDICDTDDDGHAKNDGSPSQSCLVFDRKKRRGIIEKKRRDRINHCLLELKRLVPAAFEKQGSTKLEKAEILKMTVDHLKMIQSTYNNKHARNNNLLNINDNVNNTNNSNKNKHCNEISQNECVPTDKNLLDYKLDGYRECAAEVARYLKTYEGFDFQDPLCIRLLNHLNNITKHQQLQQSEQIKNQHKSFSTVSNLKSVEADYFMQQSFGKNSQASSHLFNNSSYSHSLHNLESTNSLQHPFSISSLASSYLTPINSISHKPFLCDDKNLNPIKILLNNDGDVARNNFEFAKSYQSLKNKTSNFCNNNFMNVNNKVENNNSQNSLITANKQKDDNKKFNDSVQISQNSGNSALLYGSDVVSFNNVFNSVSNCQDINSFCYSQSIPQSNHQHPVHSISPTSSSSFLQYLKQPYRPWGSEFVFY